MIRVTTLFKALKELGYNNKSRDSWWWPNSGSFEVVIGAILTQNTTWKNVEKSLNLLKENNLLSLKKISNLELQTLETLITPSGFYRQKSRYIKQLSKNILSEFQTFKEFKKSVTREWLINQKGIGNESADAILNYACYKEAFVVDAYTNRLLNAFGYDFNSYLELQEWIVDDFYDGYIEVFNNLSRANAYAIAHGMVVEYVKANSKRKIVNIDKIKIWLEQQ